jgi:hypothetical protein
MIKTSVAIDEVIDLLNELVELDPGFMRQLVELRVECNDRVANHPTVQVAQAATEKVIAHGQTSKRTFHCAGILGIINGLFGTDEDGWGTIGATFDVDCPSACLWENDPELVVGDPCPTCGKQLVLGRLRGFKDLERR